MKQYLDLMRDIRDNGVYKEDRTGTGTLSVFGRQMRFDISGYNFPLVTTKKCHLKSIIHELIWFLKGTGDIDYLASHDVTIWDEWIKPKTHLYTTLTIPERMQYLDDEQEEAFNAYRNSLYRDEEAPGFVQGGFTGKWRPVNINELLHTWLTSHGVPQQKLAGGELGPVYGVQWRSWPVVQETKGIYLHRAIRYLHITKSEAKFWEMLKNTPQVGDEFNYDLWTVANLEKRLDTIEDRVVVNLLIEWLKDYGYEATEQVTVKGIDQIAEVIQTLKQNPDSRRMVVTAWNPVELPNQALPPCHALFQFYSRELTHPELVDYLFTTPLLRKADIELHGAVDADVDKTVYLAMDQQALLTWVKENGLAARGLSCQLYQR